MSEKLIKDAGELADKPINRIARFIDRNWNNVYFGARPYLDAMYQFDNINDTCGYDSARSVVTYFLCNAGTWRGAEARKAKAALKLHLKTAR